LTAVPPGAGPAPSGKTEAVNKISELIAAFIVPRLQRLTVTGVASWLAGVGLGQFHVSVPYLATWLLSWIGVEGAGHVSSVASSSYLNQRKGIVMPQATVQVPASAVLKNSGETPESGGSL
jgi:hypothetical protein